MQIATVHFRLTRRTLSSRFWFAGRWPIAQIIPLVEKRHVLARSVRTAWRRSPRTARRCRPACSSTCRVARASDGPASGSSMARFAFLALRMSSSESWIEPSATRSPGSSQISSQYNTAWFSTGYLDHDSSVSTDCDHPPVSMKKRDPPELFRPPQGPNTEEPLPAHARWLTRSKVGADQ